MSHCHRCNGRWGSFLRVGLDEYCFRITLDAHKEIVVTMKKPLLPKKQRLL